MKMQESNYSTTASRREDRRQATRYLHISCKAYMIPNPLGHGHASLPHIDKPGKTYYIGTNKAKRAYRACR